MKTMSQFLCFDIENWRSYKTIPVQKIADIKIRKYLHHITSQIIYLVINYTTSRSFNLSIHPSFWLFICSYLLSKYRIFCCYMNSPWWYISHFHVRFKKTKKQQNASFQRYIVLCAKTLILNCAYVGFFPVFIILSKLQIVRVLLWGK